MRKLGKGNYSSGYAYGYLSTTFTSVGRRHKVGLETDYKNTLIRPTSLTYAEHRVPTAASHLYGTQVTIRPGAGKMA